MLVVCSLMVQGQKVGCHLVQVALPHLILVTTTINLAISHQLVLSHLMSRHVVQVITTLLRNPHMIHLDRHTKPRCLPTSRLNQAMILLSWE